MMRPPRTPKAVIAYAVAFYQVAKQPWFRHERVHRGRAPAVAAALEDLLGAWLVGHLPADTEVWVDLPIRFAGVNHTWYFDILVVRRGVIRAVLDVKADVGWMRKEFKAICRAHQQRIQQIRSGVGELLDRKNGQRRPVRVGTRCAYHLVIFSGTNIPAVQLDKLLREVQCYAPALIVYVLSSGKSLNDAAITGDCSQVRVHADAFARLLRQVQGKRR